MKQKLLHFLAVFVAMAIAIPVANAAASDYKINPTVEEKWKHAETDYSSRYYSIAVSGDDIFTVPAVSSAGAGLLETKHTKGLRFSSSKVVGFSGGSGSAYPVATSGDYYYLGPAAASDSQGTFIAATRRGGVPSNVSWANPVGTVCYYTENPNSDDLNHTNPFAGKKTPINFSSTPISGRTDKMSAYGDVKNGTGYLWFIPGHSNNTYVGIERITTTSGGSVTSKRQFKFPSEITSISNNVSRIMQYSNDGVLLDLSGQYFYKGVIASDHSTITWTKINKKAVSGTGAAMFVLAGHEILAYSSSTTQITLYDVTDNKDIATFAPFSSQSSTGDTRHAIDVRVSGYTANIYVLVPGQGAGKWSITATPLTAPVTSLSAMQVAGTNGDMNVTWGKPSEGNPTKYAVQYSTDGSTWSTAVETTNLNHTYSNLAPDTYSVRVRAYFGGNGTWGNYTTVNNVVIGDPTNPVQNLNATLVDGTKGEVNVTWSAPSAGSVSKYSICYSSDNGTTWSTAVETTSLSYSYNGLTTGTYIFKVKPYYSHAWGNEATSNSVTVINATGASISNLAYKYVKNTVTNIGRQDITLTWDAPTGMVNTTVTGYKVYRNGSLLATLGADVTSYTNAGIKQNYTYKVVPLFADLGENASFGQEVTTTEVQAGVLVAPVITETRNYEGYSLVEVFYSMPGYAPYKPLYWNLYRDGKLIQAKLQSYNTLDESLVRASVETTVNYQVEAVYGSAADVYPPIDSVKSNDTTLTIAPRDWAKTGYILQEVYNVPIDEISGTIPSDFSKVDYYRQGQFNKAEKKWYIAQRGNATDGVAGVITFDAETKDDVIKGSTQYYNHVVDANVGIAIDDVGTILIKNNNNTTLAASIPTSTSINSHAETGRTEYAIPTWLNDKYDRRITSALLIAKDGTTKEVDLSNVWIGTNGFVNDMYFNLEAAYTNNGVTNYSTDYGQTRGRSDYYYMWGDVLSANGGYLVFSPSWTRTAFKVKIANGAYVSHEVIEFNRYENTGYLLEPKTGTENYGFKLDGRDDVTVQIRSNGYYGVHEWNKAGTTGWHPIFTTDSRINNAGGTSIQAFGEVDGTGRHTGELFIITPQSMHSHNVGDFLISRATKENADDYADEGSLMPSTPVAQYVQTDERSNSTATNANGNWFHAEKGTYASAMKDDDECVDIYQYVPGTRFARYRLIPSNQFPPVQPTLDITTAYNDDKTDITHFDGVATWQRPAGFGRSTGSANAKVVSYLFEMHNNKNELVSSAELPELYKTDGTPVDDEYVYDFNYTDTTGNKDIDFGRYSVNVRVKYQTKDGLYHISDPLYAEDIHDYPAKPAEKLYIEAFVAEDITIGGWTQKEDGSWVVETQKADRYRIDLDFSKPTDAEPVSYYTIKAVVNKIGEYKGDTINIENFLLHNGAEIKDGKLWAKTTSTSQIPGTYDFENAKAPYYTTVDDNGDGLYDVADGGSRQNVVLSYFYDVPVNNAGIATLANGDEVVINNTPDEWEFIIVAHYAARNTYIDKSKLVGKTPTELTPTGVEVVGDDNILAVQIYPIPAHSTITVKSPEAINSIVIYNEAGAEVMNIDGDGETMTTVNIESLATGYYFVKVNNQELVKIIKK